MFVEIAIIFIASLVVGYRTANWLFGKLGAVNLYAYYYAVGWFAVVYTVAMLYAFYRVPIESAAFGYVVGNYMYQKLAVRIKRRNLVRGKYMLYVCDNTPEAWLAAYATGADIREEGDRLYVASHICPHSSCKPIYK